MENTNTTTAAGNGAGSEAANQPVITAAPPTTTPQPSTTDTNALVQTLINAVENRTQRAETSVIKSIANQYGMSEAEVSALLSNAREEKAKALPEDVQKRIDERTAKADAKLINAEIKALSESMGFVDVDVVMAMIDRKGIAVDDEGTVTGVQEALDALKAAKPVLIGSAQQTAAWGQKQGGTAKPTKAEIMAIRDPVERQNRIAQNMDLFKTKG